MITNRTAQPVSPIEFVSLPQHKGKLENYIYKLGIAFRITSILLCKLCMSNTRLIFLIGNGANRKKVWELPAKRWIVCVSYIVGIKICANFLFFYS